MPKQRNLAIDLLVGTTSGLIASWAMGKVTTFMYEHEDEQALHKEQDVLEGKFAYEIAAEKIARLMGRELSKKQAQNYGSAMHWGLAMGAGALYGALRPRVGLLKSTRGLAFGAAFFLTFDELLNPLLSLTPGPRAFPWQAHARGLVGHLTFGVVADAALQTADRMVLNR